MRKKNTHFRVNNENRKRQAKTFGTRKYLRDWTSEDVELYRKKLAEK